MRRVPFTNWVVLHTEELESLQASPRRIRRRLRLCGSSPRVAREVLAAEMDLAGPRALERLDDSHTMIRAMTRALTRFIEIVEGRASPEATPAKEVNEHRSDSLRYFASSQRRFGWDK